MEEETLSISAKRRKFCINKLRHHFVNKNIVCCPDTSESDDLMIQIIRPQLLVRLRSTPLSKQLHGKRFRGERVC